MINLCSENQTKSSIFRKLKLNFSMIKQRLKTVKCPSLFSSLKFTLFTTNSFFFISVGAPTPQNSKNSQNIFRHSSGLPWWLSCKESAYNAGDVGLISETGRSPGEGNGNPLQYSCLENSMNRGAWRATVHAVARVRHDLPTKTTTPFN